jgi:hypothetical protein
VNKKNRDAVISTIILIKEDVLGERGFKRIFYNFCLALNVIQNVWFPENTFAGLEKAGLNMENLYKIYFSLFVILTSPIHINAFQSEFVNCVFVKPYKIQFTRKLID